MRSSDLFRAKYKSSALTKSKERFKQCDSWCTGNQFCDGSVNGSLNRLTAVEKSVIIFQVMPCIDQVYHHFGLRKKMVHMQAKESILAETASTFASGDDEDAVSALGVKVDRWD